MIKTVATAVLFASSALAQSPAEMVPDKFKGELQNKVMLYAIDSAPVQSIAGAPYTADESTTTTQTLFDGNRIVNTSTSRVYRDQQGRTRVERTLSSIGPVAAEQPSVLISINDPVAHVRYSLDPESKTAYKSAASAGSDEVVVLKRMIDEKAVALSRPDASSPTFFISGGNRAVSPKSGRREDLGNSNMAGVPVTGTRVTTVIPAGTMGNDRDINIVEERWYSPELKMNIMTRHSDPRSGETVFQVTNLTRTNPDPSLFQVPSDYQIKEGGRPTTVKAVARE